MTDRRRPRHDDQAVDKPAAEPFTAILERRLSRRVFVRGSLLTTGGMLLPLPAVSRADSQTVAYGLAELAHGRDADFHVAPGYHHQILLRWGDALFSDSPVYDPLHQSRATQSRQFGYNNDFLAFMPLPFGSGNSRQGLLVVNHEYTNRQLMFSDAADLSFQQRIDIEIAAHGLSVVAVEHGSHGWQVDTEHHCNRLLCRGQICDSVGLPRVIHVCVTLHRRTVSERSAPTATAPVA